MTADPFSNLQPLPPIEAYAEESSVVPFRFTPVGELECQEPRFLVEGLIECGAFGLVFGVPGCGKTWVIADLALSVALGRPFHGRNAMKGPVFYINGEGFSGLTRRFHAYATHHGESLKEAPLFVSQQPAQLLDKASVAGVEEAVFLLSEKHGSPALIVVDTLARNFGAGDENSTADMNAYVAALDKLKGKWPEAVIVVVHHSGHSDKGRARGSVALKGAVDFEFLVEKNGSSIRLSNTKMKDAEPPEDMVFELQNVDLGFVSSAVLAVSHQASGAVRTSPSDAFALRTYKEAALKHGVWDGGAFLGVDIESWRQTYYAHHTGDTSEAKRKAFLRARNSLQQANRLEVNNDRYLVRDPRIQLDIIAQRDMRDSPRHVPPSHGTDGTNA